MQATILKKIVYPTGGRSEFEYQANTNRSGVLIGGLRIKSIKNFIDNVATIPVYLRTFEYPGGGFQSNWIGRTNMADFSRWCYINLSDGVTFNYTSVPIGRISYSDGTTVRYPEVVEFTGPQRETKSVYNFDIFQESEYSVPSDLELVYGCTPPYPIIFPEGWEGPQVPHHFYPSEFYKDRPFRSGQLTRQTDYRKTGAGYKVVRDISNTWRAFHEQDNVIVGLKLTTLGPHHQSCLSSGDPECVYQYFNIYWDAGVKKMTQTIEDLYDTRDSLISSRITRFEYGMINNTNGHTFITKEKLIDSKGDTLWKSTRYLPEAYPVATGVYQAMKTKNMISSPMEVISGKSTGGTDYYLGSDVFLYGSFANVPKLSQVKQLQLSAPSLSYTNLTDSRLKSRVTLDSYDLNGNIVTTTPSDDFSTAYIWGYHGRYPVAKATNAKNLINYTSGTTTGELIFQSNTFTAQSSTFTHIQSGYITLVINYGSDPGTNKTARFNYYLTGPSNMSGTLCTSSGSGCGSYLNMVTFSSMPAGAYTLTVIPQVNDLASSSVYFNYSYNNQTVSSYYTELYYQGFEEYSGATASSASMPSHAGKYFKTGSFTVPFTLPNSRSYIIEYHYWNGSKWVSMVRNYTSNMTLTDGSAFDEIRVCPKDAKMTTYTYDPLVGMTSSTDENNISTYYEYDNYGKLKNVKDQDGNIIKNYDYNYKSGNQ